MIETGIVALVAVLVGWAGKGAYQAYQAKRPARTMNAVLKGIAWLQTYKAPAVPLEQQIESDRQSRMVAALTAAVTSTLGEK